MPNPAVGTRVVVIGDRDGENLWAVGDRGVVTTPHLPRHAPHVRVQFDVGGAGRLTGDGDAWYVQNGDWVLEEDYVPGMRAVLPEGWMEAGTRCIYTGGGGPRISAGTPGTLYRNVRSDDVKAYVTFDGMITWMIVDLASLTFDMEWTPPPPPPPIDIAATVRKLVQNRKKQHA